MTTIRKLEVVTLTAPLGLRFQDVVTGEFIGDGLSVLAYQEGNPARRFQLAANRSGVYALHHASGLTDFAQGEANDVWRQPLPKKAFAIEVTDRERRFLPFHLRVELPARGLYTWVSPVADSPVSANPGVPLYSAVSRQVPAGMAVARAELEDVIHHKPASWAVLEIHYNGRLLGRGVADEMGRVAVIFPYPAPRASPFASPLGSPPTGSGKPLFSQEWSLELRAFYSPPLASPLERSEAALPDLHSALGQKQAALWDDVALTTPVTEAVLSYDRELILRSRDDGVSPPARASVLVITPA